MTFDDERRATDPVLDDPDDPEDHVDRAIDVGAAPDVTAAEAPSPIDVLAVPEPAPIEEIEPLPAPIVIDLPDGQKVLIGDVPSGSIIEIATWRGPGRPDSRTNRLVMVVENPKGLGSGPARSDAMRVPTTVPDTDTIVEAEAATAEIERPETPSERPRPARPFLRRRWVRWTGVTLAALALLIGIFLASPFSMVHPTEGTHAGFGPARSTVVITRPLNTLESGMIVVAHADRGSGTVMGRVSKWQGDIVLIQTDNGFFQVRIDRIIGKVIVVIPLIGRLWWW